jgi:hypothetical protein
MLDKDKNVIEICRECYLKNHEKIWSERILACDSIDDQCFVSTIVLPFNHGIHEDPLFFETMIFNGPHDGFMDRYATYDEAVAGHAKAVAMAKGEQI